MDTRRLPKRAIKAEPSRSSGTRRLLGVIVLLTAAVVTAVLGALAVAAFHREYGDITRSGYVQGLRPGLVIAVIAAIPASLAVVLRSTAAVVAIAALILLGAAPATMVATDRAVEAKELAMPSAPPCSGGDSADEPTPEKAAGSTVLEEAVAPYQQIFEELPSPGRFGEGSVSVDGCGALLVNVGTEEAYAFYERELPAHGWTIIERVPVKTLTATRGEYSLAVGRAVTEGSPSVEVYRTTTAWRLNAGPE